MPLFPYKLHELLTEMQLNPHLSAIISWVPSGNAFKIHQPELFQEILLKKYFPRQTKINSFKRQLLYYGFDNLGDHIFAHPCFLKDKRHMCGQINHCNPTKSQREAKTSIPSRRVRDKRAKQALRHQLIEAPTCQTGMIEEKATPSSILSATSALALAPPQLPATFPLVRLPSISHHGLSQSTLKQTELQNSAMPFGNLTTMNRIPPMTTSGTEASDFPRKAQNFPLSDAGLSRIRTSEQSRMLLAMLREASSVDGLQQVVNA